MDIRTNKDIAIMLGVSEKTAREYLKLAEANKIVENTLDTEQRKMYAEIIGHAMNDRKKGVSFKQIIELSKLEPNVIRATILKMMSDPKNMKAIITEVLADRSDTKITVTLPGHINKWYAEHAAEHGVSKTKCIESILTLFYLAENE